MQVRTHNHAGYALNTQIQLSTKPQYYRQHDIPERQDLWLGCGARRLAVLRRQWHTVATVLRIITWRILRILR